MISFENDNTNLNFDEHDDDDDDDNGVYVDAVDDKASATSYGGQFEILGGGSSCQADSPSHGVANLEEEVEFQ